MYVCLHGGVCRDGGREREYRVPRKYICRQGECGYDVGVGGWKLMRTRAEGLRDRWEDNVVDKATEKQQLEVVADNFIRNVPFIAGSTVKDVIIPLRSDGVLSESRSRSATRPRRRQVTKVDEGQRILDATLSEIRAITSGKGRDADGEARLQSSPLSGSPTGGGEYARLQRRLDATIAATEVDVVECIVAYEAVLKRVKSAAVDGCKTWANAYSVEVKQNAFGPLTLALRDHRDAVIQLCDLIGRWQTLKVEREAMQRDVIRRTSSVHLPVIRTTSTATAATGTASIDSLASTPVLGINGGADTGKIGTFASALM